MLYYSKIWVIVLGNLKVLSTAGFINAVAGSLFWTVFNLYLWDLRFSLLEIALLNAIPVIISIVLSRFFGRLADRTGRKRFIIIQFFMGGGVYIILSAVIMLEKVKFLILALIYFLLGLSGAIGGGALTASVTTSLRRERSGEATGIYLSFGSFGWMIGSFVSGFMADYAGMFYVALTSGFLLILSGLLIVGFFEELKKDTEIDLKRIFRESWTFRLEGDRRRLFLLFLMVALYSFGGALYGLAFTIKMYVILKSKTLYGIISGFAGLTNMFAPYFVGRLGDKYSKESLLLYGMAVRDTYMLYLAFTWSEMAIIIFMIAPMWVFISVPTISLTTDYSLEGHESEVQSIRGVIQGVFNAFGSIMGGLIANILDLHRNIVAIDYILLVGSIILFTALIPALILKCTRHR